MNLLDSLRFSLWTLWLSRIPKAPPARIAALQQRRLRRQLRHAAYKDGPVEAVRRLLKPGRAAVLGGQRGCFPSASAMAYRPPAVSHFLQITLLSPSDPDLVAKLNALRPTALSGYASALEPLT